MGIFCRKKSTDIVAIRNDDDPLNSIQLLQMQKAKEADKKKTEELSKRLSDEEIKFINVFLDQAKSYSKGKEVIYNFRSGNINFEVARMQIGRISLNDKCRKMQIITPDDVEWIEDISYENDIKNIKHWIKYMKWLLKE